MKLAVIGEPCMDYIHRGSDTTEKQLGGILYSLVSLAVISEGTAVIYPVMNLGEDEYRNVTSFLGRFKNIDLTCVKKTSFNTRVVNLFYKDKDSVLNVSTKKTYDREENSTQPTLPVEFEQIKEILPLLDGILVNLVSGVDITLASLQKIRNSFNGYIHMDLHNLVMQTFPDGTRKQLPVKDWERWINQCNTLQMNESEISILTGDNVTEYETAEKILRKGQVKALAITRGRSGVSLYEMKEKTLNNEKYNDLDKTDVPRIDSPGFIDSTGCGDVFAASFFYKNSELKLQDFSKALHFANKMASVNASLRGVDDLHNLASSPENA
jgi:hypothetical protein